MKTIEEEGRDVDSAVESALEQLDVERDRVEIEVLEEGSRGLLGIIGVQKARVRVTVKDDHSEKARRFLEGLIDTMDLSVEVEILEQEENQATLNLTGSNLGILIGRRGKTLDALQYLVTLAVNRGHDDYFRITLDAEGYRERRRKTLRRLAQRLARKAKRKRKDVVLEPMPPHERRIIHITLQDDQEIETYSRGEEPYRKVVVAYRGGENS